MDSHSLHVTLLDGFEVQVGAAPITIQGLRCRQVLAYLVLHCDTATSAERLSDALWGDTPPTSARNSIQRFVSDLRRDLGPARARLASAGNGYRLVLGGDDWCDAAALEQALPQARYALTDGRPSDALSLIGPLPRASAQPLETVEGAFFVSLERTRLTELMADCGEVVAEARLAQGDSAGAINAARGVLEQHPYRERLCITLATALTRSGRATDGLSAIASFRSRLRDELGLDPSPDMVQTELDILLHRDTASPASLRHRPERALRAPRTDPTAPILGRDHVIRRAAELLETERIVTYTGTGGIGKTATALAVIESWQHEHGGTAKFVCFEETTAHGIAAKVGQVVGTSSKAGDDPLGEVLDRVCSEVDLLVLDNCEHIATEVGAFVDQIVTRTSDVRILATSRRPLGKVYEQVLPLKPLDGNASRELLRRQLEHASVAMSDLEADSIVDLLDELDGLPLAIEMAGASLRSVGVRDLLSRWRNDEPAHGHVNSRHRRHESIANAVRSSLEQLDADELALLDLCAFFPTDFDVAAVEALTGAAIQGRLHVLVEHSLLEVNQTDTVTRYRMLVPIRSQIRAQSSALEQDRRKAFITYFSGLSRAALDKMKGIDSRSGVAELRNDLSNIAFAFQLADDAADVESMAAIVHSIGLANGISPSVGAKSHLQEWVEQLRQRSSDPALDSELLATVQTAAAWGLYGSSDGAWYQRWETDDAVDDVETRAMAAIARFSCGESAKAWVLLSGLDLAAASDSYMRAMLCGVGAVIAFEVGAEEGHALTAATVSAAEERPSHGASFFAGLARSTQAFVRGDAASCIEILEAAAEAVDGHELVTLENMGLAGVAMTVGFILRERDPAALLIAILDRYLEQHSLDPASVAMTLDVAVLHLHHSGRTDEAALLLGLLDRLGLSMAILRGARAGLEATIDGDPDLARMRTAGSMKTTFDVLRSVRTSLANVVAATRSSN